MFWDAIRLGRRSHTKRTSQPTATTCRRTRNLLASFMAARAHIKSTHCAHLVLAGLVHPRQDSSQDPFRVGVLLERHLVPRLSGPGVELPLCVQRLRCGRDRPASKRSQERRAHGSQGRRTNVRGCRSGETSGATMEPKKIASRPLQVQKHQH